jgi:hypothetical protein
LPRSFMSPDSFAMFKSSVRKGFCQYRLR